MREGWLCPKCGIVWAPQVACCVNHGMQTTVTRAEDIKWDAEPPTPQPPTEEQKRRIEREEGLKQMLERDARRGGASPPEVEGECPF